MKPSKKIVLLASILLLSIGAFAQKPDSLVRKDSLARKVIAYAANKFPVTRTFNFEFSGTGPYDFNSTLLGNDLPKGRITSYMQARASMNLNLIQNRKWIIGTTLNYRMTSIKADLSQPVIGINNSLDQTFHYHSTALNVTRLAKIFNKTTIITGSASIDGSEKQFERVRGLFAATMLLKTTATTRFGLGFMVNLDPSAQLPALPIISYEHRFNNGLILDITLPRNVYIRKNVFKNGRVTLGSELDRTGFYLYDVDNSGRTFEYNQVDLNSGLTYEHLFLNYFVLTLKGGVRTSLSPRVFDRQETYRDPILEIRPGATGYFNIGVSFNPFARTKTRK